MGSLAARLASPIGGGGSRSLPQGGWRKGESAGTCERPRFLYFESFSLISHFVTASPAGGSTRRGRPMVVPAGFRKAWVKVVEGADPYEIFRHRRTTPRSLSCRAVTSSTGKSSIPHTRPTCQPTYMAASEARGCRPI